MSAARGLPWLRIFVEGVVIVGSILLAFAIDAWWDGRQDRAQEHTYLRLLVTDMQQTLDNNARFGGRADSIDWAGARLVRAYYEPELPPRDSILKWFAWGTGHWVVQPTLGTVQSLVSTGDIDLIRDDSVRVAVSRYLNVMTAFEGFEQKAADDFLNARDELSRHVDLELLRLNQFSVTERDSLASTDNLFPFPAGQLRLRLVDVQALVRNEEVHRILERMNRA